MISALLLPILLLGVEAPSFQDATYSSRVFAGERNYRVFLPAGYQQSQKRYPVIYYFHGHSDRYTLEAYDKGQDTVPKIAKFVKDHDAIVVAPDGFVAKHYTSFYAGTPYDVSEQGGDFDFGEAFQELIAHIDGKYRTQTGRRYRATSGLSMGGFMSLWLSARYPELVGSASAFNPGPEFFLGESGRRSLWRPKDHVALHESASVRLVRASGDYISQYHEETRAAYARTPSVDFEFRQDEYHRHWATSIGETFEFHLRAFNDPRRDQLADHWTYTSPYRSFEVRGYQVSTDIREAALVSIEDATADGFRLRTRRWAPDGPAASCRAVTVTTAPLYVAGKTYGVSELSIASGAIRRNEIKASAEGRLTIRTGCDGSQIHIQGNELIVLPEIRRFVAGEPVQLKVRIWNPGASRTLSAELRSEYPTVKIEQGVVAATVDGTATLIFPVVFNSGSSEWAHARLHLKVDDKVSPIDVEIAPDGLTEPIEMRVLDGRTQSFHVFRQKGNQGGGGPVTRTVTEGSGNGDGILQPGERATIWLKLPAGIDGLDRGNWCRAKVYSDSPWLTEVADIQEQKQLEWTGAKNRTSLIEVAGSTPSNVEIPLILDCESWTYHFTPDLRYGSEALYQAFQIHKHHLFRSTWSGRKPAF
ncbi:alpha/beta hydrolase [Bryobacter aggregatus]|uniref:alpha/beta hydrolase n=1 Tax=Bryobacter aggregatus TaxID=360054 RepID=UPI0004E19AA8|nr:alpha/beta hydrolase [Bryobacter aggregatus]